MKQYIVFKLVSGQFWLAIAAAIVLVVCGINGVFSEATTSAIVGGIVSHYFNRKRDADPKAPANGPVSV